MNDLVKACFKEIVMFWLLYYIGNVMNETIEYVFDVENMSKTESIVAINIVIAMVAITNLIGRPMLNRLRKSYSGSGMLHAFALLSRQRALKVIVKRFSNV